MCLVEMLIQNYFLYRKDQVYTCHCSKQTSKLSQLQNKKIWIYLQLISLPFTYWIEVNLRALINRRWEWITLSVRWLTVFEENIVVTVLAKLVPLFFRKCTCAFFLTRSLIDRCQIVTDTCKNNVSNFFWKPFQSPFSLRKWKSFGEASL